MLLPTNSFWYQWLFRRRARIIRSFIEDTKTQWRRWGERTDLEYLETCNMPPPNAIKTLLAIGAVRLSKSAFMDVCRRIIDQEKVKVVSYSGNDREDWYSLPHWINPNPFYPLLKDTELLPFLQHCKKCKLGVSTLSDAAFEAARFVNRINPPPTNVIPLPQADSN